MTKKAIVWIREDLRIENNPALSYASQNHEIVSALYIYNNKYFDKKREAQKWWLSKSLDCFKNDLAKFNISLEILSGDEIEIFTKIKKKNDITVYWSKVYEPAVITNGKKIRDLFIKNKIDYKYFKGNILIEFQDVTKDDGTPFKVFTPFWKKAEQRYLEKVPSKIAKIKKLNKAFFLMGSSINPKNILPKKNWYKKFEKYWDPSEDEAKKYLKKLIEDKIINYSDTRDFPSIDGTSKISPFLKHGQIHVETIWNKCQETKVKGKGYRKYINELGWREFSHSLINYFPEMLKGNLRKQFDNFPWVKNQKYLKLWKQGMTGYPLVDAGMRELYETGWMHNRIRMVVGSFLVKNLLLHWHHGEKWFWDCLVDADLASNSASWQWIAGCGADAAPYFRIFNPVTQGQRFDPEGEYIRKYIPEIKELPNKYLFSPWVAPQEVLDKAGVLIGKDYPSPIIDLKLSRNLALEAFKSLASKNI